MRFAHQREDIDTLLFASRFDKVFCNGSRQQLSDAVLKAFVAQHPVDLPVVVNQRHIDLAMRQCNPGELLDNVAHLGIGGPHELPSRRKLVKKIPHFHRCAVIARTRFDAIGLAAVEFDFVRADRVGGSADDMYATDSSDARKRLAPKPHRRNAQQVVARSDLARRMGLERDSQIVRFHTAPVVGDSYI